MNGRPKESDWKMFRKMVPELRERYLERKNKELIQLLDNPSMSPTENFWNTVERMEKEEKILRDCLDDHSRSTMDMKLMLMCRHRMIDRSDLNGFSEELRNSLLEVLDE